MKKQNGITLIALVVTIIVLLILAGVSIATLTGDNGILTRASNAKETQRGSEVDEMVLLTINENQIASYSDNVKKNKQQLVEELYSDGKLTEEEKNKLLGQNGENQVDKITIGSIEVDFSKLKGGSDTLYWDGNTEGLIIYDMGGGCLVRVSNVVPTIEDFTNGFSNTWNYEGGQEVGNGSMDDLNILENGFFGVEPFQIFTSDITMDGVNLGAGIYFLYYSEFEYNSSLTINGYTGF